MSTTTPNLNLKKPALTDPANITDFNSNWDTLDTEIQALKNDTIDGLSPNKVVVSDNGGKLATGNITTTELNYLSGATSNIQNQLDNMDIDITGAASTIKNDNLTKNRALISDTNGKVAVSPVTNTELGYLDGVTSNIQTQFSGKVAKVGDTMNGALDFKNDSEFRAISKTRAINGTTYYINWGCGQLGGEGIVAMELQLPQSDGTSTVLGRLEVGRRGVSFLDANNKRTYLYSNGLTAASVE